VRIRARGPQRRIVSASSADAAARFRAAYVDSIPSVVRDLAERETARSVDRAFVKQNYDGAWSVIPLRSKAGADQSGDVIYDERPPREFGRYAGCCGTVPISAR